jgi:hypothetical protein
MELSLQVRASLLVLSWETHSITINGATMIVGTAAEGLASTNYYKNETTFPTILTIKGMNNSCVFEVSGDI